ncbi:unnamed protein product [Spirodela intermedia]|uniref:Uncharacterized protein n=2 Tax=Spirodela intermedia TaxID=51605 RepID=A0A7I8IFR6_SPIIN|nr:unnamed protein product [Spirodela intermedia]CAA6656646.1 unnamed protein product [Spirodela intermedia]CAA7392339.1 unnamed protein product [Spirodela intermedia]
MTFDWIGPTMGNGDKGMGRAKRACVFSVEEVGSEAKLAKVEASISLVWERASYSIGVKVMWKLDDSTSRSRDMEEKCCAYVCEKYDHRQGRKEGIILSLCDGHIKSIEINLNIKLIVITMEGQEVRSRGLIDIRLLDDGLEATIVGQKREIVLFAGEKRLEDLYNLTNVHPIDVYGLHSKS